MIRVPLPLQLLFCCVWHGGFRTGPSAIKQSPAKRSRGWSRGSLHFLGQQRGHRGRTRLRTLGGERKTARGARNAAAHRWRCKGCEIDQFRVPGLSDLGQKPARIRGRAPGRLDRCQRAGHHDESHFRPYAAAAVRHGRVAPMEVSTRSARWQTRPHAPDGYSAIPFAIVSFSESASRARTSADSLHFCNAGTGETRGTRISAAGSTGKVPCGSL